MIDAFATAMNSLFADRNMAVAVEYTPDGGAPVTIKAIRTAPDEIGTFGQPISSRSVIFEVRASDVPNPQEGDRITFADETRIVQGVPQADAENLSWTLDTQPA